MEVKPKGDEKHHGGFLSYCIEKNRGRRSSMSPGIKGSKKLKIKGSKRSSRKPRGAKNKPYTYGPHVT